jgi:hypothetical protein
LIPPLGHRRVDVPRLELVEVVGLPEGVGAFVADEPLALGKPCPVVGLRAVEGVDAGTAVEDVLTCAAAKRVDARVAQERVVALSASE